MPTLSVASDLLDMVQNELRIPVTNLTERAKIEKVMALTYGDLCSKQDWWWLMKKATFRTQLVDTSTLIFSVTQASSQVQISTGGTTSVLFADSENWGISFSGNSTSTTFNKADAGAIFRIESQTSLNSTAFTLDSQFPGGTSTSETAQIFSKDLYELPTDTAKVIRVNRWAEQFLAMQRIGPEDMSYLKISDKRTGPPQYWTVWDFITSSDPSTGRTLWIHPFPDKNYRLEVWYKSAQAGDLSDIAIPIDYQQVLVYGTLARAYPIFLNDLERGAFYQGLFNDVIALMAAQQREYASDHPGLNPSADLYRPRTYRGRRHPGTLGNLFDRWPYSL